MRKRGRDELHFLSAGQKNYLRSRFTYFGEIELPTLADIPGVIPSPDSRYKTRSLEGVRVARVPIRKPPVFRIKKPRILEAYEIGGRGGWIHFGKGRAWREKASSEIVG